MRASLIAASFASAPELQKKTRSANDALAQLVGEAHHRLGEVEVADVPEPARLRGERLRELRVAVTERRHADAGAEVDVLVPVDVPHAGAGATVENHLLRRVVGHVPALPRGHELTGLR